MKLRVDQRYLALPVSWHAKEKKLSFLNASGKLVYDLDIRLDPVGAQFFFYADLKRFMGETLEVSCEPAVAFVPELTGTLPDVGGERFRPEAHFAASRGWINDPNGLVFYEGQYHLFFQYNPAGVHWGNMHWGHAVSDDLMHWKEQEVALFPDELGTMYSGSAVIDEENRSGLKQNEHAPLLLFYTAAGGKNRMSAGKPFTQCMAYSVDGARTFQKYEENPVVPHMEAENRDPKIVFCEELNAYIMALYLDESRYALLRSDNLLAWEKIQEIELPGDNECPDFFPLSLDGEKYWVLSGAHDCYLVGEMRKGRFIPVQEAAQLGTSGRSAYAAQSFWQLADGRRVRIYWNTFHIPNMPFQSAMATPVELYLNRSASGQIRLACRPVRELERLHGAQAAGTGVLPLPGRANDLRICVPEEAGPVCITLMGLDVWVNPHTGLVRAGEWEMRAEARDGAVRLRLIQDVNATEIYPENGSGYLCVGHLADLSLNRLDAPDCVRSEVYELKNYRLDV